MTTSTEQKVLRLIERHNLIKRGDKLLLALSGGRDSVYALIFLKKFQAKLNIELAALHVNHLLRGEESDEDEKFCKTLCEKEGIEYYSVKVDVKKFAAENKFSIEEAARELRYKNLDEYLQFSKSDKIVTAHIQEDNTETVLFNMLRGTGLKGLAGIPLKRDKVIRPFLTLSKEEITNYLVENNIDFRDDSTNEDISFKRNYLRLEILPMLRKNINPALDENIFKLSEIVTNSYSVIKDLVSSEASKNIIKNDNSLEIKLNIRTDLNDKLLSEAIKINYEDMFGITPSFSDLQSIIKLMNLQVGKRIDLSSNFTVVRERESIVISVREIEKVIEEKIIGFDEVIEIGNVTIGSEPVEKEMIEYEKSKNVEYISADNFANSFTIRKWRNGDTFKPLGMDGTKKISDFLTEQKVKSGERKDQFVLVNKVNIVWVVGLRIDDRFKVTNKTKKVLKLWVK